jgi:hypothetical protein
MVRGCKSIGARKTPREVAILVNQNSIPSVLSDPRSHFSPDRKSAFPNKKKETCYGLDKIPAQNVV